MPGAVAFTTTTRESGCRDRHMRTDTEQEIDGAVAIFDSDPARHPYAAFMPPVLAWFFDGPQG